MPLTPDELVKLVSAIDILNTEVSGLRFAMINADKRAKWARSVAIIGVVAGIIGLTVGFIGVTVGASAQSTADDLAATRTETQISSCIQANVSTQRTKEALKSGVSVLTQPDPRRDSAAQASLDRFIVEYSAKVDAALPFRDCSPRGIAAYFARPPADPALGSGLVPTTTTTR